MKRNFGLDIMRSVSILLVLLQHIGFYVPGLAPLRLGGVGVEVFFVLSGFLIGGILFREIDKGQNLYNTLKSFWIRRWFRILPLYYLVLLVKFTLIDHSIGWNIFYYFFFLQNNFYGIQFLDVSWSLVIEEWFYLFSPFFLFVIVRSFKSDTKTIVSIIIFIILVLVLRTFYVAATAAPYVGVNGNFPFRFDSLFIGVLLSFFHYRNLTVFHKMSTLSVFLAGLLLFLSYLALFICYSAQVDEILIFRAFGFLILPFTISIMVPFVSVIKIDSTKNSINKYIYLFFTTTSVLTYALYLTHPFVNEFISRFEITNVLMVKALLSLSLTFALSWLVYTFFEKPILKYRDKIKN